MTSYQVTTDEEPIAVTVTEIDPIEVTVSIPDDPIEITVSTVGAQGAKGESGKTIAILTQPGVLATGTGATKFYFSGDATITGVYGNVGFAPSGSSIIVDVNVNNVTIFTDQNNRLEILDGESLATATPDVSAVTAGDFLTVDLDQVGSTYAGGILTVQIEFLYD